MGKRWVSGLPASRRQIAHLSKRRVLQLPGQCAGHYSDQHSMFGYSFCDWLCRWRSGCANYIHLGS